MCVAAGADSARPKELFAAVRPTRQRGSPCESETGARDSGRPLRYRARMEAALMEARTDDICQEALSPAARGDHLASPDPAGESALPPRRRP